eukprot:CAMPEP_0184513828 /NCGR_PEP_ID=MMETSP0198_2-20121128/3631_1 /TAXON_ID=1112570 /ORGANISM="Thraustochytrium sp., Strain LLF1b" /LENGTH=349 /DNA_ID=CAMNT_0026903963 /DNA_START=146 /DNA_END=1195 /DNA_ORIENTATION=-
MAASSSQLRKQVIEGAYAVKGHTFALAAEDSANASNLKEASLRHATAHSYFEKVFQVAALDCDKATAEAIEILSSYHKAKSLELKRLAKSKSNRAITCSKQSKRVQEPKEASQSQLEAEYRALALDSVKKTHGSGTQAMALAEVKRSYSQIENLFDSSASTDPCAVPGSESDKNQSPTSPLVGIKNVLPLKEFPPVLTKVQFHGRASEESLVEQLLKQSMRQPASDDFRILKGQLDVLRDKFRETQKKNESLQRELALARKELSQKNEEIVQARTFRNEYQKRFSTLKLALQNFQEAFGQEDSDDRYAKLQLQLKSVLKINKELLEQVARKDRSYRTKDASKQNKTSTT